MQKKKKKKSHILISMSQTKYCQTLRFKFGSQTGVDGALGDISIPVAEPVGVERPDTSFACSTLTLSLAFPKLSTSGVPKPPCPVADVLQVDVTMQHYGVNGYSLHAMNSLSAMYNLHQQAAQQAQHAPDYRPSVHALTLAERLAGKNNSCLLPLPVKTPRKQTKKPKPQHEKPLCCSC